MKALFLSLAAGAAFVGGAASAQGFLIVEPVAPGYAQIYQGRPGVYGYTVPSGVHSGLEGSQVAVPVYQNGVPFYLQNDVYAAQRIGRDRDRDGVPDRYDNDRDNDGIPNHLDRRPNDSRRH